MKKCPNCNYFNSKHAILCSHCKKTLKNNLSMIYSEKIVERPRREIVATCINAMQQEILTQYQTLVADDIHMINTDMKTILMVFLPAGILFLITLIQILVFGFVIR